MTLSVPIISVDVCLVSLLWIVDEALPQEDGMPGRTDEDVFGVICCFSVETGVDALILRFFFDGEADDVNKKPLLKAIFYLVPFADSAVLADISVDYKLRGIAWAVCWETICI